MMDEKSVVGRFTCPHQDGDFTVSVNDLQLWSTGSCLIRQEGQHEVHDIVLTADECDKLSILLKMFADRYRNKHT